MAAEYAQLAFGKDSGTQQTLNNASQDRQSSARPGREGILAGLRKTLIYFANVEKFPIVSNFTSRRHGHETYFYAGSQYRIHLISK
ncbi:hypothetical protein ACFFJ4_16580 [Xanthomonas dyei]|uniref:Uncharacterized protein n=1 Tax=Xanthomonas dyei TaxID=743699 RepID=A0A2S7BYS2_9XANT|nr:hypothetical protein [Xanthomonas dyei]PPU54425.1 hypothetical protein XdyCFBP7245_18405 [Xanthomonas dyei]